MSRHGASGARSELQLSTGGERRRSARAFCDREISAGQGFDARGKFFFAAEVGEQAKKLAFSARLVAADAAADAADAADAAATAAGRLLELRWATAIDASRALPPPPPPLIR